jgi:hypothetical protein
LQDVKNRKGFFVEFARTKAFDPLLPDGWYSVTNEMIINSKVTASHAQKKQKRDKNRAPRAFFSLSWDSVAPY